MTLPMHERIRSDIEAKILSGDLTPGDRLPTEHQLMAEYQCARMTVNKALSALATAGWLDRRKRAGSFVAQPRLHSMVLDIPDLKQEVLRRGQAYHFTLLKRDVIHLRGRGSGDFDLGPGPTLRLSGLHFSDGRALAVERRIVSLSAAPDIKNTLFVEEPPGTWLLRRVPWNRAETRISAAAADQETADLLLVKAGDPLLQIERRTWRGDDRVTSVRQSFRAEAYDLFASFSAHDAAARGPV